MVAGEVPAKRNSVTLLMTYQCVAFDYLAKQTDSLLSLVILLVLYELRSHQSYQTRQ